MAFTPGARQKVQVANVVRPILSNLINVNDACDMAASKYLMLSTEAQAEVAQVITVGRFIEMQATVLGFITELNNGVVAYEGPNSLPLATAE